MWMMLLHLHVNLNAAAADDDDLCPTETRIREKFLCQHGKNVGS